jgi:hypothetical protein
MVQQPSVSDGLAFLVTLFAFFAFAFFITPPMSAWSDRSNAANRSRRAFKLQCAAGKSLQNSSRVASPPRPKLAARSLARAPADGWSCEPKAHMWVNHYGTGALLKADAQKVGDAGCAT